MTAGKRLTESAGVAPSESPLVPNSTLRRMYLAMVEERALAKRLVKGAGRGQEACRAAALIDLQADDLSSDFLEDRLSAFSRTGKLNAAYAGCLPQREDSRQRLGVALGAALLLKRLQPGKVTVVLVEAGEAKPSVWRESLQFAAEQVLPVLFVVLPKTGTKAMSEVEAGLSARATKAGVPGIPVDASDTVALFRVAQECILRARSGGGAALLEGVAYEPPGRKKMADPDPIRALGETLLRRQVCDEAWLAKVKADAEARFGPAKATRRRAPAR